MFLMCSRGRCDEVLETMPGLAAACVYRDGLGGAIEVHGGMQRSGRGPRRVAEGPVSYRRHEGGCGRSCLSPGWQRLRGEESAGLHLSR